MKNKFLSFCLWVILVFGLLELVLRFVLGIGNPLLFEISKDYGYRVRPSQNILLFGKRISINAQGLRSKPVALKPDPGVERILCLGDSITFGGVSVAQADTYPYLLEGLLDQDSQKRFEVLNCSAPGWAIENEEAYLKVFGVYNSRIVLLQLSMDDMFQLMNNGEQIDRDFAFSTRKPVSGAGFLLGRLLEHYFPKRKEASVAAPAVGGQPVEVLKNLVTLRRLAEFINSQNAKFCVFVFEEPDAKPIKREVYDWCKQELAEVFSQSNATFADISAELKARGGKALFSDRIHPNAEGNRVIAQEAQKLIMECIKK